MRPRKRTFRLIAAGVVLLLAYPAWMTWRVWDQSHRDEVHSADAIVVLGAAQYDGDPSPVFRARLNHSAYLYNEGISNQVIVTGGKAEGDRFSEAEAGARYLVDEKALPAESIQTETDGKTTLESLTAVRDMTDTQGIETVLFVSDPLHAERIKIMADDLGFDESYVSWASYLELERSRSTKAREIVREVASIIAYQLFDR